MSADNKFASILEPQAKFLAALAQDILQEHRNNEASTSRNEDLLATCRVRNDDSGSDHLSSDDSNEDIEEPILVLEKVIPCDIKHKDEPIPFKNRIKRILFPCSAKQDQTNTASSFLQPEVQRRNIPLRRLTSILREDLGEYTSFDSIDENPKSEVSRKILAFLLSVLSGILFTLAGVSVKLLRKFNPAEILLVQATEQIVLLCPILLYRRDNPFISSSNSRFLLLLYGVITSVSHLGMFYSFHRLPVSDAVTITINAPVIVSMLSSFLNRDANFGVCKTISVTLISAVSILFLSRPSFLPVLSTGRLHVIDGLVPGYIGLVSNSLSYVITQKIRDTHFTVLALISNLITTVICALFLTCLGEFRTPTGSFEWILLASIGIFSLCSEMLFAQAFVIIGDNNFGLFAARTFDVSFAFLLQFLIFDKSISWTTALAALINAINNCFVIVGKKLKSFLN